MTIKIIINVCLPSQCILSQQTVLTPFSLSSFLDKVIQKKIYKYTQVTWPGGPINIKKFHMHKVTAATSLPGCTQNRALFMLLLHKSTVNSGYSTELTGWRHEAWWTLEKVSSDGKYHSSFVYTSIYTVLKCQGTQQTALWLRCTP